MGRSVSAGKNWLCFALFQNTQFTPAQLLDTRFTDAHFSGHWSVASRFPDRSTLDLVVVLLFRDLRSEPAVQLAFTAEPLGDAKHVDQ